MRFNALGHKSTPTKDNIQLMKRISPNLNLFGNLTDYPEDPVDAAEFLSLLGFKIVPFLITVNSDSSKSKKVPLINSWTPYDTPRDEILRKVSQSKAFCIIVPKGTVVLDLDCAKTSSPDTACSFLGLDSIITLADSYKDTSLEFLDTVSVNTPTSGLHLWFRCPPTLQIKNSAGLIGEGVDLRVAGKGLIMMPSSQDSRGRKYEFDPVSGTNDVARMPRWLTTTIRNTETEHVAHVKAMETMWVNRIKTEGVASGWVDDYLNQVYNDLSSTGSGSRNNALNAIAYGVFRKVAGGYIPEEKATHYVYNAAIASGLSDHEVKATMNSAFKAARNTPYSIGSNR